MRRYTIVVDGQRYTIDVEETAADRFEVSVGDRTFVATLQADEDLPGAVISPEMTPADEARGRPAPAAAQASAPVHPRGPEPASVPEAARRHRPTRATDRPTPGPRAEVLAAPMPGVVLEVLVTTGARLRRGDPLLVLEAMKMRNTIRCPRPATVVEVAVEAGEPVRAGDPLVRLAPIPG